MNNKPPATSSTTKAISHGNTNQLQSQLLSQKTNKKDQPLKHPLFLRGALQFGHSLFFYFHSEHVLFTGNTVTFLWRLPIPSLAPDAYKNGAFH